MKSISKAISITAGGLAVGTALTLGMAYGFLIAIINDEVQEDL